MKEFYCEEYDSTFDSEGNWLEKECDDPRCNYCVGRPEKHPADCECLEEDSE